MLSACTEYLKKAIKDAMGNDFMGDPPQVFTSMTELKTAIDVRCAAVLVENDTLKYVGKPRLNTLTKQNDQMVFERTITIMLVMGDENKNELNQSFEKLLLLLARGITHNGHYISVELEEPAEWIDKKDSIINANIAVEMPIKFIGGVYKPISYKQLQDITIGRSE